LSERCHEAPILNKLVVPERQKRLLDLVYSGTENLDLIAERMNLSREDLMRDVEELKSRGLLEVERREVEVYEVVEEAKRYADLGMPEGRLLVVLEKLGEVEAAKLHVEASKVGIELTEKEVKIGLGQLARLKALVFEKGKVRLGSPEEVSKAKTRAQNLRNAIRSLSEGRVPSREVLSELRSRGLIEVRKRRVVLLRPTSKLNEMMSKGLIVGARVITALTPEILASEAWRGAVFKPYDLSVEPPRLYPGKKHPYLEFLDWIREILVSMGFEEVKGPHVELELWNFDALFQAQDHPAREIHDTYFLKYPRYGSFDDKDFMNRIAKTHENGWITGSKGWGYKWNPMKALRLILRTQTTAVSARTLYQRGDGEYMCFSLDRVFRPETLDPKHSMEFYQLEGIIVGRNVTFRHLIGFFDEIAKRLGLGKVKLKPGYFPFTEPSVEGFIKHPTLGWIEVFPGGMFRPEMLAPLGLKESNVAAWGIGIDRIAMTVLGVDDIRLLFTQDIDFLRKWRRPIIKSLVGP